MIYKLATYYLPSQGRSHTHIHMQYGPSVEGTHRVAEEGSYSVPSRPHWHNRFCAQWEYLYATAVSSNSKSKAPRSGKHKVKHETPSGPVVENAAELRGGWSGINSSIQLAVGTWPRPRCFGSPSCLSWRKLHPRLQQRLQRKVPVSSWL